MKWSLYGSREEWGSYFKGQVRDIVMRTSLAVQWL